MSAAVEPTSKPRLFRAWCEQCQDGVNFSKDAAMRWAAKHNAKHHPAATEIAAIEGQQDALELLKEGGPIEDP